VLKNPDVTVVGGGLAGSEAAWQLAERGYAVLLREMRPEVQTPAHTTPYLGELVCSNSLGGDVLTTSGGILKEELRRGKSLIIQAAEATRVPAGKALAVGREGFARYITEAVEQHPGITRINEEVVKLPSGPAIIATGPLTSPSLAEELRAKAGGLLAFYDAVAPVVTRESIDFSLAYRGNRWEDGGEDYINCPLNEEEYHRFWEALSQARRAPLREFESKPSYFEGCLPVEIMASRGRDTLRFGPLRPVGLKDPRTGRDPYGVVQLRQDNLEGTLFNLVGFQTNLLWGEQERIFRMIPGLEKAEFVRFGVMHRNSFVNAPRVLDPWLRLRGESLLFLAGQLCGVEGYMESTAAGYAAALYLHAFLAQGEAPLWPRETALGSLLHYLQDALPESFQPMNCNLGLFPPLGKRIKKRQERCLQVAQRALEAREAFLSGEGNIYHTSFRKPLLEE
jgi:methylenetetrahydrofolate--tRNA-(uracil-5-)-methyltransferase